MHDHVTAGTSGAEIRLLGPVEATGPNGAAELAGARRRGVVGLLALRTGSVVPPSDLVDALWGDAPPRTAVRTLHSHVARIRQALQACGLPDAVRTKGAGYQLVVESCDVDAHRFEAGYRRACDELAGGVSDAEAVQRAATDLREGLALWRGPALGDADLLGWGAAEAERLQQLRLSATEELWHAELLLGGHARAVPELHRLFAEHPMRERFARLLMLALYRTGQQVEALTVYERLRVGLADELGVDPSPESQRLHVGILRRDPDLDAVPAPAAVTSTAPGQTDQGRRPPRPAQVPAPSGHFTGRVAELAALDALLTDAERARVGLICGPAGMGKTALAVQWAHGVGDRFPDGQLFLEFGGGRGAPVSATETMARVLASLGVAADLIPASLSEQTDLFRSTVHDHRILILADDVGDPEQVLPLVPPTDSSLLLATSRFRLPALGVRHAVRTVEAEALDHESALALLAAVIGPDRVAREREAAEEIVERCGRMPLALRIAAARLAARPRLRITDLVDELADDDRISALSAPGDGTSVRAVLNGAYDALSQPAARSFRVLGGCPGITFSAHLVAAATDSGLRDARHAVEELATAHMISEVDSGRFRFHDLIRFYARERGRDEGAAVERMLRWYLATAHAANQVLTPGRDKVTVDVGGYLAPFKAERAAVLGFLDGERENLVPVVAYAAGNGYGDVAWQMAYLLAGYFTSRGLAHTRVEMCRHGLAAAGDPSAEGLMRTALGVACNGARMFDEAIEHFTRALALARAADDVWAQGSAYNNLAVVNGELGRLDAAAEAFGKALQLHTANGDEPQIALALNNLASTYTRMGCPDQALDFAYRALEISRGLRDSWLEAMVLQSLGEAYLQSQDHDRALEYLKLALFVNAEAGHSRLSAETLCRIGDAHMGRGDASLALDAYQEALALGRETGDRQAELDALSGIDKAAAARHGAARAAAGPQRPK